MPAAHKRLDGNSMRMQLAPQSLPRPPRDQRRGSCSLSAAGSWARASAHQPARPAALQSPVSSAFSIILVAFHGRGKLRLEPRLSVAQAGRRTGAPLAECPGHAGATPGQRQVRKHSAELRGRVCSRLPGFASGASTHDDWGVTDLASQSLSPSARRWGEYCSLPRLGRTGKLGGGIGMQ